MARPRCLAGSLAFAAALALVSAWPALAADKSITVNFPATNGTPTYRASGWIYGMTGSQSGRCVDVPGSTTTNARRCSSGTATAAPPAIQLWQCLNGANQKWSLRN